MFLVVLLYGFKEFLLGQTIIFVRHTEVPQDVFVAWFWHQAATRQLLSIVLVWPYRDDLEFLGLAVEVHLEEISPILLAAETGKLAPLLERDALHQPRNLVLIGVELHTVILEVIYREWISILTGHLLGADSAYHADPSGIYIPERRFLVMVHTSVFVGVDLDILAAIRQLETRATIFLRIDVAAAPHWVKPGVKLDIVSPVRLNPEEPFVIAE